MDRCYCLSNLYSYICKTKPIKNLEIMNAQELLDFLLELQETTNLSNVNLHYRFDYDTDADMIVSVEEYAFDEETNSTITDIVFVTDIHDK